MSKVRGAIVIFLTFSAHFFAQNVEWDQTQGILQHQRPIGP